MSFPADLAEAVAAALGRPIRSHAPVGGGCIAHAARLDTDGGAFFLKYGRGEVARTFAAEAAGLRALREAGSPLVVPEVVAVEAEAGNRPGFLLMQWIETGRRGVGFWEDFGRDLAALHRRTAGRYGFDGDNFIGRAPQRNRWADAWPTFFRACRLAPQVATARKQGRWQRAWDAPLDALYRRLDDLLPPHPPASLLHGDLWSGNVLATRAGRAALVDPAAYYGHREADLAMTELFGGFAPAFYAAYRAAWPLETGYAERREVYNLYHLLNHLNLFGGGYAEAVASILKRFC